MRWIQASHGLLIAAVAIGVVSIACRPATVAPNLGSVENAAQPGPPLTAGQAAPTSTTADPSEGAGAVRYTLVEGEVRYRVREQLLGQALPSDAVGGTRAVQGGISLDAEGRLLARQSKFTVDLRTLRSNESRRDNYIQGTPLETRRFPLAEFVPDQVVGLASLQAPTVEVQFQLLGDLTVHGVTRSVTWEVTLHPARPDLVGTTSTSFALSDFGMRVPRVGPVLSTEDKVTLELDFRLRPTGG